MKKNNAFLETARSLMLTVIEMLQSRIGLLLVILAFMVWATIGYVNLKEKHFFPLLMGLELILFSVVFSVIIWLTTLIQKTQKVNFNSDNLDRWTRLNIFFLLGGALLIAAFLS